MKVLFAVSNEEISEAIVKRYQKQYKEIISYKNVYYFNAILKEIQKDKTYDRIVISEELEAFTNSQYDQIDRFIFDKLDSISDEASNTRGDNTPIILICSDRRNKGEEMLVKLFGIGIYDALIGNDRGIEEVCNLIYKPRSKKEAKLYYKVESDEVKYQSENENDVSEQEIQNILAHYKKLGKNEEKYVTSFDNIVAQYNDAQLRIISKFLPLNVRAVLEEKSPKYQQVMSFNNAVSDSIRKPKKQAESLGPSGKLLRPKNKTTIPTEPIVIPNAVNTKNVKKLTRNQTESVNNGINGIEDTLNNFSGFENNNQENTMLNDYQNNNFSNNNYQNNQEYDPFAINNNMQFDNFQGTNNYFEDNSFNTVEENEVNNMFDNTEKVEKTRKTQKVEKSVSEPVASEPAPRRRGRPRKNPVVNEPEPEKKTKESQSVSNNIKESNNFEEPSLPGLDGEFENFLPGFGEQQETRTNSQFSNVENEIDESDGLLPGFENFDSFDQEPVQSYDPFNQKPAQNNDSFNQEPAQSYDPFNQESAQSYNSFNQEPAQSYDSFNQEPAQSYDSFNQEPAQSYDSFNQEPAQSYDPFNQEPAQNNDSFNQEPAQSYNSFNQEPTQSYDSFNQEKTQKLDSFRQQPVQNNNIYNTGFVKNYGINNNYSNNMQQVYDNGIGDLARLLTDNKKIATFVGTSKNGTSFIVNNLAEYASSMGINVAILDTTKNKNSYYIYTKNEEELRKIASNCLENLINGQAKGIGVNKNLTVYTSLPEDREELNNVSSILETLVRVHDLILIDCDFDTPYGYFESAQEIYLVQSYDILTIQPLTAFLRELKAQNILDQSKLKILINKYVRVRGISEKTIIGGMSKYNDPAMSFMTDLFDVNAVKFMTIQFEQDIYTRYLESIINCDVSIKGYSKTFMQTLKELNNWVYQNPMSNNSYRPQTSSYNNSAFSADMNNTLNQMRKKY